MQGGNLSRLEFVLLRAALLSHVAKDSVESCTQLWSCGNYNSLILSLIIYSNVAFLTHSAAQKKPAGGRVFN